MNRLAIILYILMEAVLIIATTQRLPVDPKSNNNKFLVSYAGGYGLSFTTTIQPSDKLYSFNYNIDGIQVEEDGHLNHINTEQEALEARGSYIYTDAEENTFHVSHVANENGFQPEGAHLPVVPSLIEKALQYIAYIIYCL